MLSFFFVLHPCFDNIKQFDCQFSPCPCLAFQTFTHVYTLRTYTSSQKSGHTLFTFYLFILFTTIYIVDWRHQNNDWTHVELSREQSGFEEAKSFYCYFSISGLPHISCFIVLMSSVCSYNGDSSKNKEINWMRRRVQTSGWPCHSCDLKTLYRWAQGYRREWEARVWNFFTQKVWNMWKNWWKKRDIVTLFPGKRTIRVKGGNERKVRTISLDQSQLFLTSRFHSHCRWTFLSSSKTRDQIRYLPSDINPLGTSSTGDTNSCTSSFGP